MYHYCCTANAYRTGCAQFEVVAVILPHALQHAPSRAASEAAALPATRAAAAALRDHAGSPDIVSAAFYLLVLFPAALTIPTALYPPP